MELKPHINEAVGCCGCDFCRGLRGDADTSGGLTFESFALLRAALKRSPRVDPNGFVRDALLSALRYSLEQVSTEDLTTLAEMIQVDGRVIWSRGERRSK